MKARKNGTVLLLLMWFSMSASAATDTSISGQLLFNSKELGKSGRSCATCHLGGKGLEKIGDFSDSELKDIINACIRDALHGTKFPDNAPELEALRIYISGFKR